MKRTRFAAAVAAVTIASMALAGCSGGGGGTSSSDGTLTFYSDKSSWPFDDISGVSKKDIDISLKTTFYTDQDQYVAFVKQSLRTPASPGLFTWHTGDQLEALVEDGILADTSSIWKKALENGDVSESLMEQYTVNGKQYCVPISVDDWVMFYNKKVFADNNIEVPTTWDEMISVAQKLKSVGATPFYNSNQIWSFVWFQEILAHQDLKAYEGLATGETKYTDPAVMKAMDTWLGLIKDGYFSDPGSKDPSEVLLRDGDVAMVPNGTWFTASLDDADATEDYGMFPIPGMSADQKTPVATESAPACVPKASNEAKLGLKYSSFWMEASTQSEWSGMMNNLPYNPKAKAATPAMQDLSDSLNGGDYTFYSRYYEAAPAPILTEALSQFGDFVTHPGDPKPFMEKIQAAADKYWKSQK